MSQRVPSPDPSRSRADQVFRLALRTASRVAKEPEQWAAHVLRTRKRLGAAIEMPLPEAPTLIRSGDAAFAMSPLAYLGEGGVNRVYQADELSTGRRVAVRIMAPAGSYQEEERRRERAPLLARLHRLDHPGMARHWGLGQTLDPKGAGAGIATVEVYDFVPGTPLRELLNREGLSAGDFLTFARQLTDVVAFLHEHGLVHGDVKAENCIITQTTEGQRLTLLDPDLLCTPEQLLREARLGRATWGTPSHLPPEHSATLEDVRDEEAPAYAAARDVYAMGVTFAQMLAGEPMGSIPVHVPSPLRVLVSKMRAGNWRARPTLADTRSRLESTTLHDPYTTFLAPNPCARLVGTPAAPAKALDYVGDYQIIDPSVARIQLQGKPVCVAKLQDRRGRAFAGFPESFFSRDEAETRYEECVRLLHALDDMRLRNPTLFPGTFHDVVRHSSGETHSIYILRPFLEGRLELPKFLADTPLLDLGARVGILRRVAMALEALEEAGFIHADVSPAALSFIPAHNRQPDTLLGPGNQRYRQELMELVKVQERRPDGADPAIADLLRIAISLGVANEEPGVLEIFNLPDWGTRAAYLLVLEHRLEAVAQAG